MRELNRRPILGVFVLSLALVGSVGPVLALNVDIPEGADESTRLGFTVYDIIEEKKAGSEDPAFHSISNAIGQ